MDTLGSVIEKGRDRDGPFLVAPDRAAPYTYREFCTNAWKAGNLLRHYGVRPGANLAVVVGPKDPTRDVEPGHLGTAADPLLALLGGAAAGATVDLAPETPVESRALVGPDAWLDRYDAEPGCSRLAYGGPPDDAGVAHFERELWSENPTEPPAEVAPDDPVLALSDRTYTHREVLDMAKAVSAEYDLDGDDSVVLDGSLTEVGAIAAGVVAPLSVGATVRLGASEESPGAADAAYVVSTDASAGEERLGPTSVTD